MVQQIRSKWDPGPTARLLSVLLTHQLYPCRPLAAYTGPPSSMRYTSPLGPDCFSEVDLVLSLSMLCRWRPAPGYGSQ